MTLLQGTVQSGAGQGARFVSLEWVRTAVRRLLGFDPYPGTLNLWLLDHNMALEWREIRKNEGLLLAPPPPEQCGGRLIPIIVAPNTAAAVIVPDITRYGDEVLEIIAPVHLRSCLGLRDNDRLTLTYAGAEER